MQRPDDWSVLHGMSLLYISFATITDGDLSEDEMRTIVVKVAEWDEGNTENSANACKGALEFLTTLESVDDLQTAMAQEAAMLNEVVPHKAELLKDMAAIAMSDGKLHDNERGLINTLAKAWQVEFEI